jgi:hypothetical protein
MPQNGLSAYLHHGFRLNIGFFAQTGSKSTGKYDYFHASLLFVSLLFFFSNQ